MRQDALAEQLDGLHDALVGHARPVQSKAHLLDVQALLMPRDLFDAVCGIANDEPILPQLLDGQTKRLTRGQDVVLAPLRVGFVLGGCGR